MKYEMTRPCNTCPFRNDGGRLYVDPDRLRSFARGEFVCHETAEVEEDDEYGCGGDFVAVPESQHCAGALIFYENADWRNLMTDVMITAGKYDPSKLKMDSPVFKSWDEVDAQTEKQWLENQRRDKKKK